MIHLLKTWPEPFRESLAGLKPFEIRRDDRGFEAGDLVVLQEWEPATQEYSGREMQRRITCVTRQAGPVALLDGLVVLGMGDPQGLGCVTKELARLVAFLGDLARAMGVPMAFGEVEEERMLDWATALVAQLAAKEAHIGVIAGKCDLLAERLVAVRDLIRSAHGTLLLGSAPQAREHPSQAAKDLTDLVEGRV